jgi:hypothetical protein
MNEQLINETQEAEDDDIFFDAKTDLEFITEAWLENLIEQTCKEDLMETFVYTNDSDSENPLSFYIFFKPEDGQKIPDWYPKNVEVNKIYPLLNSEPLSLNEMFCLDGYDDLKKIAIKHMKDFS